MSEDHLASVDAEAALLSALLIDNRVLDEIGETVSPGDFTDPFHGRLFAHIAEMASRGQLANPVTLRPSFIADPDLPESGIAYLGTLTENMAALIGARDFAAQIADLARGRRLRDGLAAASARIIGGGVPDAIEAADAALWEAAAPDDVSRLLTAGDAVRSSLDRIAHVRAHGFAGMRTGLAEFDALLGGIEAPDMIVLGARPGMGKTVVASELALGVARQGIGVLFVSLEMRGSQLGMRMASSLSMTATGGVRFSRIRDGSASDAEVAMIRAAHERMRGWPLLIVDAGRMTLGRLAMTIRRQKRSMGAANTPLGLVVIDYLQLLHTDKPARSNYEAVSEISRTLKALAKDNGVAVLAVAQLSRGVEERDDKRPMLSDLRDSGQIEQDADAVVFLYRDEYYLARREPEESNTVRHRQWQGMMQASAGRLDLIAAKVRNGRTGNDHCRFHPEYQAVRAKQWEAAEMAA